MPTTFFKEFRDQQSWALEQATPTIQSGVPFRRQDDEQEFVAWANDNPVASFRRFGIQDEFDYETVGVSGNDVEQRIGRAMLVVAYPNDYRYGPDGGRDRLDVIREDTEILRERCGSLSHRYLYYASAFEEEFDLEQDDAVSFLVMRYRFMFWEDLDVARDLVFYDGSRRPVTVDGMGVYS